MIGRKVKEGQRIGVGDRVAGMALPGLARGCYGGRCGGKLGKWGAVSGQHQGE